MSVVRSQASIKRGQTASYVVSVWTTNGSASGVTLKLAATPSSQKATFALGCGSKDDGTATCDVGTVDSTSVTRQLEAQIAVASSASSVTSVKLTATGSATNLKTDPASDATVSVTAASSSSPSPSASPSASTSSSSDEDTAGDDSTLPAGTLPSLNGSGSSYTSGGGNASGLFPTINPSSEPSPSSGTNASDKLSAEPAADTSTLPLGTPVVGAQIVGLGALAIACGLAVTRLSLRRRPAPKKPEE